MIFYNKSRFLPEVEISENQDFSDAKIAVRKLLESEKVCRSAIELDETTDEHKKHVQYEI